MSDSHMHTFASQTTARGVDASQIPHRLSLTPQRTATGIVDGAWWPRSRDLPAELPELTAGLGRVEQVSYNISRWDVSLPSGIDVDGHWVRLDGCQSQHRDTVDVITTDQQQLTLLVVPPESTPAAAQQMLAAASARGNANSVEELVAGSGSAPAGPGSLPYAAADAAAVQRWELDGGRLYEPASDRRSRTAVARGVPPMLYHRDPGLLRSHLPATRKQQARSRPPVARKQQVRSQSLVASPQTSPALPGAHAGHRSSNQVTAALISYLEAVATTLNGRGVAVAGVEITTADQGLFSGRIQLAQQRIRNSNDHRGAVELRWGETTGWEVALRPTRSDAVSPWRFLHAELVPGPGHVSSFVAGLLRGEDLGMNYPASFRARGVGLAALASQLSHAARTRTPTATAP